MRNQTNNNRIGHLQRLKRHNKPDVCDEMYTPREVVESHLAPVINNPDMMHGATVLLPCDDPEFSQYTAFFVDNFDQLNLSRLISTSMNKPAALKPNSFVVPTQCTWPPGKPRTRGRGKILNMWRDNNGDVHYTLGHLEGNGDFRSEEITKLRDEADFIFTNPPFTHISEFVKWCDQSDATFSTIAPILAISYKHITPIITENRLFVSDHLGNGEKITTHADFVASKFKQKYERRNAYGDKISGATVTFLTNDQRLHKPAHVKLRTMRANLNECLHRYPLMYRRYFTTSGVETNAIDVPSVRLVPSDYAGVMGVPVTFFVTNIARDFECLGLAYTDRSIIVDNQPLVVNCNDLMIDGRRIFKRIFVRRIKP